MHSTEVLKEFQARVDIFVNQSLSNYNPERHAKDKSIRDAVWGTSKFYSWEMAILDSPLLQRLRDIRQTGAAYLVYPTAQHSRFDHTLGMVTVASRIVRSINEKYPLLKDSRVSYADHMLVRLSALLHDVGHSCLSHVSELVYGESEEFKALIKHINDTCGVTPKAHEIMSWLIVRSQPFKKFLEQLKAKKIIKEWDFTKEQMDEIAGNIIGHKLDPAKKFLADIINGPMDADKLDYLVRDAFFAGPTGIYDLDRFLHTVDAIEYPREDDKSSKIVRLSIPISGVTALEQIIISKLMLFSYLYHHQKIRCVEGMYHEVLKRWVQISKGQCKKSRIPSLDHPVCFLNLSDRSLLPDNWPPGIMGDKISGEILDMLIRRELYKRALVISRLFIPDIDINMQAKNGFERLLACATNPVEHAKLRELIYNEARNMVKLSNLPREDKKELLKKFKIYHLLIDIPRSPTVEETHGVMVPVSSGTRCAETFVPLIDIFPIEKWVDAYNAIKWRGHIFTIEEAIPFVNKAALKVLYAPPYYLNFTNQATEACKIEFSTSKDFRLESGKDTQ